MNFELKVKDVLLETFILTGKIEDSQIINNLINFIKNNKDNDLGNKTHVKGYTTGFQSLINNKYFLDFLNTIQPKIRVFYNKNFSVRDAWGNLCKMGEEVTEHDHKSTTAFCGILYLTDGGPGTYFKEHDLLIEEEIGKYVLFHPFLKHSVKKIEKNIERITVAFNIAEIKEWEKKNEI